MRPSAHDHVWFMRSRRMIGIRSNICWTLLNLNRASRKEPFTSAANEMKTETQNSQLHFRLGYVAGAAGEPHGAR